MPCGVNGLTRVGCHLIMSGCEAKNRLDRQVQVKCRLTDSPTNVWTSVMLEAEDYGLKASITPS